MVRTCNSVILAMKFLFFLLIVSSSCAFAEPPRAVPSTRYSRLWIDSPFTTKPPPVVNAPDVNPLEDYALGGVSPVTGGYRVTLLNRKNPEERIIIPDNPDFKILSVQYAAGNPLGTTVRVATGSKSGTVSFDEKLLTLKAAPAPQQPQPPPMPGIPAVPGQQPQEQQAGQATQNPRTPRPRVVPPAPAPPYTQPATGGQVNPPPQGQTIPQQHQQQQRPQRR